MQNPQTYGIWCLLSVLSFIWWEMTPLDYTQPSTLGTAAAEPLVMHESVASLDYTSTMICHCIHTAVRGMLFKPITFARVPFHCHQMCLMHWCFVIHILRSVQTSWSERISLGTKPSYPRKQIHWDHFSIPILHVSMCIHTIQPRFWIIAHLIFTTCWWHCAYCPR